MSCLGKKLDMAGQYLLQTSCTAWAAAMNLKAQCGPVWQGVSDICEFAAAKNAGAIETNNR